MRPGQWLQSADAGLTHAVASCNLKRIIAIELSRLKIMGVEIALVSNKYNSMSPTSEFRLPGKGHAVIFYVSPNSICSKIFTWQKFVIKAVCVVSVSQAMAVRVAMAVLFGGMLLFN